MVFPVVMYRCESWIVKNAKHRRTEAVKLSCWRRLSRAPRTARRSNQSILKEINPGYSLEGLLLKPQNFGHLMCRAESLKKTLMLGKIEGRGRREWQRIDGKITSLTQWTWFWANSGRQWRTEEPGLHTVHGVTKKCTRLSDWKTTWAHNLGRESISYSWDA